MERSFVDLTVEDPRRDEPPIPPTPTVRFGHLCGSNSTPGRATSFAAPVLTPPPSNSRKRPRILNSEDPEIDGPQKRRLIPAKELKSVKRVLFSSDGSPSRPQAAIRRDTMNRSQVPEPESGSRYRARVNSDGRKRSKRAIDLTKGPEPEQSEDTVRRLGNPPRLIQSILIKDLPFQQDGVTFEVGLDLELEDESFFRIEKITRHGHRILFKGRRLFHPKAFNNNKLPNIIPHARNELIWVPQRTSQVLPDKVVGITKVVFTNERSLWGKARVRTCRLKVFYSYRDSNHDNPVKNANWVVRDLTFEESDPGTGLTNKQLREKWRGPTTPFGEAKVGAIVGTIQRRCDDSPEIIDLDNILPTPPPSPPTSSTHIDLTSEGQNAYTFGDGFCGAGGASCGAKQAGLKIKWSFDINEYAMKSYEADAFSASRYHALLTSMPDLLPAHTVNNEENDDRNSACLIGIRQAVERVRPRILTMEETFGLEHDAHRPNLNRVIMDLIELGYSVRWEVIKLAGYGVPQIRKRLILIAAGPGENLCEFPRPTFGGPGQPRLRTIRDAIYDLPIDSPNHDVATRLRRWSREYRKALDWDEQAKTITTAGGQENYHPDGRRTFTDREIACLQTFPRDYQFYKTGARKQIGNAFPPMAARAIYEAAKESLRKTDLLESVDRHMRM
ncbi:hypothetical protein N7509_013427 [Penicillium cosmopolitanum]|uniref:DNA (cytosine-5-)-methyltransferase n=1 Tax=Penicillium cosmopolitanum TaxID=1131564 RepID=A0A9W9VEL7_9EURO|nr:uncharacterized protein N7509_013427 [Penicillium cosmopolitanum]KAJ5376541.1 hypothetical protein N7509_013427 [Penicillium cosmopolitanum]